MKKNKVELISIVVPIFNEAENIPIFYNELKRVINNFNYEIIFVDDGSNDSSDKIIKKIREKNSRVKLISLSRNFGHQIAITCGLDYSNGEATIIMDADLQDPPNLIPKMIEKWRQGFDVVFGTRTNRDGDSYLKKATANIFYKIIHSLSGTKIPQNVGDYRLISKRVILVLRTTREYQRFLRGIISWVGFQQTGIEYVRGRRHKGKSKYTTLKMLKLALDAIFSFSFFPLRIASLLGIITAFGAFILIFYTLYVQSIGQTVKGWSSTIVIMLFLGSIQLISIGIIGEYMGRIYEEVKKRPLYIIKSVNGFKEIEGIKSDKLLNL